jgi:opacity protein-like surface antigen
MNFHLKTLLAAAALSALSATAFAQAASAPAGANTPGIDKRQANQEKRIDQGIASGSLTKPEARRLERQQAAIDKAEDKAKADGTVTKQERRRLHHAQDHASKRIYRQKHDRQNRPAGN